MKVLQIGLPCTPAKNINLDKIVAIEVLVTWGGGMGGSSKKYYCTSKNINK